MAPTTQQKILAAYNGFYGTYYALCLVRLVLSWLLRAAGHFLLHEIAQFFPESKFCHHHLTECVSNQFSLSLSLAG